jgi:AcrR family transcriptional regulator
VSPDPDMPIWLRNSDGRPGPRPRHTLDEIAEVALRIADTDGLDAVTMRRLAADLGTGPASLYRYVESKADLEALVTDRVIGEYMYPPLTGSVPDDVLAILGEVRAARGRHPWLAEIRNGLVLGPNGISYLDRMVAAMEPLGADAGSTMVGVSLLTGWAMTFGAQEATRGGVDPAAAAAQMMAMVDPHTHPHLTALMATAADSGQAPMDVDETFRRGVESLVAGIGRR